MSGGDLHDTLIRKAARWLLQSKRCTFVMLDPTNPGASGEQPDVIGWRLYGWSILVECKASRADFLRDRDKPCRRACQPCKGYPHGDPIDNWDFGLGQERWYCAAPGVIRDAAELPEHWGWIELRCNRMHRRHDARTHDVDHGMSDGILRREYPLLLGALRRAHEGRGDVPWLKFDTQPPPTNPEEPPP